MNIWPIRRHDREGFFSGYAGVSHLFAKSWTKLLPRPVTVRGRGEPGGGCERGDLALILLL
jgi:hypothetical protein